MSLYASQPWLSEIPSKWSRSPLKFVLRRRTIRGRAGAELLSVYRDHGVVPKSSRDDNFNRAGEDLGANLFVEPGDLVVNKMKAWQGSLAVSDHEGIVSPAYFTFSVARSVVGRYLHHLLRNDWFIQEYVRISSGIRPNQWDLDIYAFGRLIIPLPPRDNQRRIAAFLDRKTAAIDALIAKKERQVELLEEKLQAIITQAVTKGLDPNVRMKHSGIPWMGMVPAHWAIDSLGRRVRVFGGATPSKDEPEFWDGAIPWVSPKDMKRFEIADSEDHVSERALSRTSLRLIDPPVVLMVTRGMILARLVPIALTTQAVTLNQDMKALRPMGGLSSRFLAMYLKAVNHSLLSLIEEAGHGTKTLRTDLWTKFPLLIPPEHEQKAIERILSTETAQVTAKTEKVLRSVELLVEYRQALISAAVTGKIEIPAEEAA